MLGVTMNSRITNVEIKPSVTTTKAKHTLFVVEFTVDGNEERDWVAYDKPDELAVFQSFKNFITFTYPERTS
jgi:predicted RecB family nuclease